MNHGPLKVPPPKPHNLTTPQPLMGLILAVILLVIGVLFLIAYGGTPHAGPTASCTPINFFGQTYSINGDCRYISIGEVGLGIAFILLALFVAVASRPRGPVA